MTQRQCVLGQWDGDQIVAEAPIYADGTVAWDRAEAWVYEPVSFRPLAKLQGEDLYYVVTDHIGTPRELISEDGTRTAWRARLGLWGGTEALTRRAANDNTAPDCPIRFQGQWFDEESGLHYNRFRYYDPEAGQYLSPDPIGLAGGTRPQGYVADPNGWVDPLGLNTCSGTSPAPARPRRPTPLREQYLGSTPGKNSRTGRQVRERMRREGNLRTNRRGQDEFLGEDGNWYPVDSPQTHMGHNPMDAVDYWNTTGRNHGAKSPAVRQWMLDPDNYRFEYGPLNSSRGGATRSRYLPPAVP